MSAPTTTTTDPITPGKTWVYVVRTWDDADDAVDVTVHLSPTSADWAAARTILDMVEERDDSLFRELERIRSPREILDMFQESPLGSGGEIGAEVTMTLIAR